MGENTFTSTPSESNLFVDSKARQKKESKHKMIDRMREMGMVLTMLNIKQKEIAKYEEFANLREEGLRYSESLLNQDIKNFIDFFKSNRDLSSDAMKQAEMCFK